MPAYDQRFLRDFFKKSSDKNRLQRLLKGSNSDKMILSTTRKYGRGNSMSEASPLYGFVRFGTILYQCESIKLSLKQSIYQHSSYGTNVNYHTKDFKNLKSEPCPEMVIVSSKKIDSKNFGSSNFCSKNFARKISLEKFWLEFHFGVCSDFKIQRSLQITTNVVYGRTYLFST